ncbi:hypothetical protein NDU88_011822 [Pleurodeles waltl]|uniref:Secreted protein n=1 Tax=Pleurodeles waltl TaxID=8319 RepID=A0AAV7QYE2_PLEWA|nr:hypothetical protein NDU88_011822 [Pleurodeles waltl]
MKLFVLRSHGRLLVAPSLQWGHRLVAGDCASFTEDPGAHGATGRVVRSSVRLRLGVLCALTPVPGCPAPSNMTGAPHRHPLLLVSRPIYVLLFGIGGAVWPLRGRATVIWRAPFPRHSLGTVALL